MPPSLAQPPTYRWRDGYFAVSRRHAKSAEAAAAAADRMDDVSRCSRQPHQNMVVTLRGNSYMTSQCAPYQFARSSRARNLRMTLSRNLALHHMFRLFLTLDPLIINADVMLISDNFGLEAPESEKILPGVMFAFLTAKNSSRWCGGLARFLRIIRWSLDSYANLSLSLWPEPESESVQILMAIWLAGVTRHLIPIKPARKKTRKQSCTTLNDRRRGGKDADFLEKRNKASIPLMIEPSSFWVGPLDSSLLVCAAAKCFRRC